MLIKITLKLNFGSLRGKFYFRGAIIVPVDAQPASEMEVIGTGSEKSTLQRFEEWSPLCDLTVFSKKPDYIKACVINIVLV